MSFNKSKAMKNAERYLTQGKINAAISEYKQIVENDSSDINSRNMLGDLYTKANDNQAAVNCYKEVADHYNSQGFAKKAIAIYNKIYRIDPSSMEITSQLAELYQERGSYVEARKLYREIATRYEEKGHKIEALAIWEKIAQIAPNDTEIYLKIAEAYWQSDRRDESAKAYIEAGNRLANLNKHEGAITAYSRSLEVNPEEFSAVNGFVKSQLALGFPEEGISAIEKILENRPLDKQLNYLLMECYIDMDNFVAAEAVVTKLVEREPANYPKLLELTEVYLKNDDLDSAIRVLTMTSEHLLVGGESEQLLEHINEVLARNPEHLQALRLLARYHGWQRDELELQQTLERIIESASLVGAIEDERYALSQFLMIVPHDVVRSDRLKQINNDYGFGEDEEEQLLHTDSEDVPTFESFATLNNDENDNTVNEAEIVDANEQDFQDKVDSEFNFDNSEEPYQATEIEEDIPEESNIDDDSRISAQDELSPSDEMKVDEEMDSIKFYIDQGYIGLAEKSLNELESNYGKRDEFIELRQMLPNNLSEEDEESSQNFTSNDNNDESFAVDNESVQPENVQAQEVIEPLEELDEEFVSEVSGDVAMEQEIDAVVLDSPLEDSSVEPNDNIQTEAKDESTEVEDTSNSFEDFKDDLGLDDDTEPQEANDYEEHYQHAVVYQEMGMLEEAIREFQDAVSCIDANDGTRRYLNCCTLIGHCFMQKEMPNLALSWFEKAFETNDLDEKETLGIYYEIANAYESNEEFDKAINQFEMIYAMDVDYRDIGDRLEKLRENSPIAA